MARVGGAWTEVNSRFAELRSRIFPSEAGDPKSFAVLRRRLDVIVSCVDLTSLRGDETHAEIEALCVAAVGAPNGPASAAVCVYPAYVRDVAACLRTLGVDVGVAAVGSGFPTGEGLFSEQLEAVEAAVRLGADELDVVLDWRAYLSGEGSRLSAELREMCEAIAPAKLKVIVESGALPSPSAVAEASTLALDAGAAFIKTSTGKFEPGAEFEPSLVMLETLRDHCQRTGRSAGFKVSGGVRTVADAMAYAAMTEEILGIDQITPDRFRVGASSLLEALVDAGARGG